MKIMNKSISLFSALFVAIFLFSCGEKQTLKMWQVVDASQDVTNQGKGTVDLTVLKGELQSALTDSKNSVIPTSSHGYQYSNANTVDVFAGYTTVSRNDFQYGPRLTNTYEWPNGYYGSACSMGPTSALYNAYTYSESLKVPEYKAIAQIVYAQTALHAVNNAGCVPYHDNRNLKVSRPLTYLSMEETYNAILADLDEAISTLKKRQPNKEALIEIEGDAYDKGDVHYAFSEYRWEKWVKLANTVKLRIAMYLAKPNPSLAEQVANEVLSDEIGVLDEDFGPGHVTSQTQHPYYQISAYNDGGWQDSRLNASFENILKRTGSPLLDKYFKKNTGAVQDKVTGKKTKAQDNYYGIRQGTEVGKKTNNVGYFNFSDASVSFKYQRLLWVCKEEAIFLKAEAALRWGIGGDVEALYYEGIKSALDKYDIGAEYETYISQTKIKQQKVAGKTQDIHFVDIHNSNNNIEGRYNLGVKWDSNASKEEQLERLITQKWIAIYPSGHEAWVDFRRTGYPRLFPSVQKWSGVPSFPVELQIRRIPHDEGDENVLIDLPYIEQALGIFGKGVGLNSGGERLYFEGDPAIYPWTYDEKGWFVPKNF